MAKDFFEKMDRKEKAQFINDNLDQGVSFKDIYETAMHKDELAQTKDMLLEQFRKAGYRLNVDDRGKDYVDPSAAPLDSRADSHKAAGDSLAEAKWEELLGAADDLLLMLEWWKTGTASQRNDPRLTISIPLEGEDLRKSIRINSQVWEAWKSFCRQHADYSEKDLLAKALLFFISNA